MPGALTIIYHPPGAPGDEEAVGRLAAIVSAARRSPVRVCSIDGVLDGSCSVAGSPVLLMHMRGGHWFSLRSRLGVDPVTVPAAVTASWIYSSAGSGWMVYLVYMPARRMAELQSEDLEEIIEVLRGAGVEAVGAPVRRPGGRPEAQRGDAGERCLAVPLAMFRGGIWRSARMLAGELGCGVLEPMALSGFAALASWLSLV